MSVAFWRPVLWLQLKALGPAHFAAYQCDRCAFKVRLRTTQPEAEALLKKVTVDHVLRCQGPT